MRQGCLTLLVLIKHVIRVGHTGTIRRKNKKKKKMKCRIIYNIIKNILKIKNIWFGNDEIIAVICR